MIYINNFTVNNDGTKLLVNVSTEEGETITSALVWSDYTYKDYDNAVNVSSLLSGTTNQEVFEIEASTLGVSELQGIYFIEFQTTSTSTEDCPECDNSLGVAASFLCFKECLLTKVLEYSVCNNFDSNNACGSNLKCDIINIYMLLTQTMQSLEFGYYGTALDLLNKLRKLCNCNEGCTECGGCSECDNLPTPYFKTGLNYGTLDNTLILL